MEEMARSGLENQVPTVHCCILIALDQPGGKVASRGAYVNMLGKRDEYHQNLMCAKRLPSACPTALRASAPHPASVRSCIMHCNPG